MICRRQSLFLMKIINYSLTGEICRKEGELEEAEVYYGRINGWSSCAPFTQEKASLLGWCHSACSYVQGLSLFFSVQNTHINRFMCALCFHTLDQILSIYLKFWISIFSDCRWCEAKPIGDFCPDQAYSGNSNMENYSDSRYSWSCLQRSWSQKRGITSI